MTQDERRRELYEWIAESERCYVTAAGTEIKVRISKAAARLFVRDLTVNDYGVFAFSDYEGGLHHTRCPRARIPF